MLKALPDSTIDAVITDPPYAIVANRNVREQFRGHGTRPCAGCAASPPIEGYVLCVDCLDAAEETALLNSPMLGMQSQNWHLKATHSRGYADNDNSQFQRWCLMWATECHRVLKPGGHLVAFGGTRTWHRLASAIEDAGFDIRDSLAWLFGTGFPKSMDVSQAIERSGRPGSNLESNDLSARSKDWLGWGTALKPAHEPIVLARKPLIGTVAANVTAHGTGGLNIGGCRVRRATDPLSDQIVEQGGRWPANVFLEESQADLLDAVSGGPASRFFWVAKPDQAERVKVGEVTHPTVKPITLMRELVRLVTPPGGTVLDPFAGSGTTVEACILEGFNVVAIEKDPKYIPLIRQRVDRRRDPVRAIRTAGGDAGLFSLLDDADE